MFGGDDDDDFMPASNSKLASLFSSKSGGEGNTSLTYTAPKQPKKVGSGKSDIRSSKTQTATGSSNVTSTAQPSASNKLGIIIVKAVNTYKLEDGSYNLQGKLGAAVLGNAALCVYQLLLYKGKQQHITSTKITPKFQFTVQPNNYGTFYDDQKQNWSIHFDQDEDAEEFAKEIGLARGNSQGGNGEIHDLLTQDLSTGEGPPANVGDSVEIFYSVRLFTENKLGQLVESNLQADKPQRVKIRKNVWEEGLIGATKGSKRIILLPSSLVGPWKQEVPPDVSLVVEVEVGRLKQGRSGSREGTPNATPALADSGESAVDSGADETSIRARGEALTASPKTHKANIISRMARMGQATLPLKGAVTCDPSDTEDSEEEVNSSPKPPIIFKPSPKVRSPKTPSIAPNLPSPPENHSSGSSNMSVPPQQMAVFQSLPTWQPQSQAYTVGQYGIGQLDGQLYPLVPNQTMSSHQLMSAAPSASIGTPPGMPSSADGHLSVFLSETRTHNTEVRIGMAKVADKVDQVLAKLDSTVHTLRPSMSSALLDSTSLLASIQRLVSENEQLKSELTEKGNKIDVQNDRIYQLLNTNHKYLEQSNTSSNDQRNHEAVVAGLQRERTQLLEDLRGARDEAKTALAQLEGCKKETASVIAQQREELAKSKSVVLEQDTSLQRLTERLKTALETQDTNEKTIATLTKTLLETQESNDGLKAGLSEMTCLLERQKIEADEEINKLNAKYSAQLEALEVRQANFKSNSEVEPKPSASFSQKLVVDQVKKVMNVVYTSLHREFITGETYFGESIKETLAVTIRDITCQLIEKETFATPVSEKSRTVRSSASQRQEEKLQLVTEIGDASSENVVVSLTSHSGTVGGLKHTENDLEDKSAPTGYSGTPRELLVVSSEPLSKLAVNLPSKHDILRTDTGSPSNGTNQIQRDISVVPPEPRFNTEDLNPSADGPKDIDNSSSSGILSSYTGGNAGDIPTVLLAKLPGETDLSVKLIPTDSETIPETFSRLRVTSDSCVLGTPPTPKMRDDSNRPESMSTVIPDSTIKPTMVPTTTDTVKVDGQQLSTNKNESTARNLRESSLERKPWRSEPPPLFDDDEDEDDWLS